MMRPSRGGERAGGGGSSGNGRGATRPSRDCEYWLKGHCKKGDTCTFLHDPTKCGTSGSTWCGTAASTSTSTTPTRPSGTGRDCEYWLKGHCKKGDTCTFLHDPTKCGTAMSTSASTSASTTPTRPSGAGRDCEYWLKGHCKKGDTCTFLHEPTKRGTATATMPSRSNSYTDNSNSNSNDSNRNMHSPHQVSTRRMQISSNTISKRIKSVLNSEKETKAFIDELLKNDGQLCKSFVDVLIKDNNSDSQTAIITWLEFFTDKHVQGHRNLHNLHSVFCEASGLNVIFTLLSRVGALGKTAVRDSLTDVNQWVTLSGRVNTLVAVISDLFSSIPTCGDVIDEHFETLRVRINELKEGVSGFNQNDETSRFFEILERKVHIIECQLDARGEQRRRAEALERDNRRALTAQTSARPGAYVLDDPSKDRTYTTLNVTPLPEEILMEPPAALPRNIIGRGLFPQTEEEEEDDDDRHPNSQNDVTIAKTEKDAAAVYRNRDHYLNTHFLLLREDFLAPLRRAVRAFRGHLPQECLKHEEGSTSTRPPADITVLTRAALTMAHARGNDRVNVYLSVRPISIEYHSIHGILYVMKFMLPKGVNVNWARTSRFMTGALLILSSSGLFEENDLILASVTRFNVPDSPTTKSEKKGTSPAAGKGPLVVVSINPISVDRFDPIKSYTMIEAPVFFEPFRPVLEALKDFDRTPLPFENVLLGRCGLLHTPEYLLSIRAPPTQKLSKLSQLIQDADGLPASAKSLSVNRPWNLQRVFPSFKPGKWSAEENHIPPFPSDPLLDDSQRRAIALALSKEIALIQGPPGTGKTFVGVIITRILLENWDLRDPNKPILFVTQTNHALDAILEKVHNFEPNIIRVGGRSKSQAMQALSLDGVKRERNIFSQRTKAESENFNHLRAVFRRLCIAFLQQQLVSEGQASVPNAVLSRLHSLLSKMNLSSDCCQIIPSIVNSGNEEVQKAALLEAAGAARRSTANKNSLPWWAQFDEKKKEDIDKIMERWVALAAEGRIRTISEAFTEHKHTSSEFMNTNDAECYIGAWQRKKPKRTHHRHQQEANDSSGDEDTEDNTRESLPEDEIILEDEDIDPDTVGMRNFDILDDDGYDLNNDQDADDDSNKTTDPTSIDDPEVIDPNNTLVQLAGLTQEEHAALLLPVNVRGTPTKERVLLVHAWRKLLMADAVQTLPILLRKAQELLISEQQVRARTDAFLLKDAKVVGMTTTGAAKYRSLLHRLQPEVVVVEEAAEVLEANIIASLSTNTKHLILIGDHMQLRPQVNEYRLEQDYQLGISLFERLIDMGIPHVTLSTQRRMHPDFSALIRPTIYKCLDDAPETKLHPPIRGLRNRLFFFNHSVPEDGVRREDEIVSSKTNSHEAMLIVRLAIYLLQNGYKSDNIVCLSMYKGQSSLIKKHLSSGGGDAIPKNLERTLVENLKQIHVTTTDNYQGEECNIVLLSLVRSNPKKQIGFLRASNRLCVGLSRAQHGMYVFGNFDMICDKSDLWLQVCRTAKDNGALGTQLLLQECERHSSEPVQITKAEDFNKAPNGRGCTERCNEPFPDCGHICTMICHVSSHLDMVCPKPCERARPIGCTHPCRKVCGVDCGECEAEVVWTLQKCGHTVNDKPCGLPEDSYICRMRCTAQLLCGHKCDQTCHNGPHSVSSKFKCTAKCGKALPCGHQCEKECYQTPCPPCPKKSTITLPCGHKMVGNCSADPNTIICLAKCDRTLPGCGHKCTNPCSQPCLLQSSCVQATNKEISACAHSPKHMSSVPCNQQPNTCPAICGRTLPGCEHMCTNKCGNCTAKGAHKQCSDRCQRTLTCGHKCTTNHACGDLCCPACSGPCTLACEHGKCSRQCGLPCEDFCTLPECLNITVSAKAAARNARLQRLDALMTRLTEQLRSHIASGISGNLPDLLRAQQTKVTSASAVDAASLCFDFALADISAHLGKWAQAERYLSQVLHQFTPESNTTLIKVEALTLKALCVQKQPVVNVLDRQRATKYLEDARDLVAREGGTTWRPRSYYLSVSAPGTMNGASTLVDQIASIKHLLQGTTTKVRMSVNNKQTTPIASNPSPIQAQTVPEKNDDSLPKESSPLHVAVWRNDLDAVRKLLKLGEDVCVQDEDGNTPLHIAVQLGSDVHEKRDHGQLIEIASELMNHQPSCWHVLNKANRTFGEISIVQEPSKMHDFVKEQLVKTLQDAKNGNASNVWAAKRTLHNASCSALDEIMKMTGIPRVKRSALDLYDFVIMDKKRPPKAQQVKQQTLNFVFLGNPGCGKTTVARLFGQMLCELDVREGNNFVETTGQDLVAAGATKFINTTLPSCIPGVLFVDEVYQLEPNSNSEGKAITNALMKETENNRTKLTVIIAGYKDDVRNKFMNSNPGLQSRFNREITFDDFDEPELRFIFMSIVREKAWVLRQQGDSSSVSDTATVAARRLARGRNQKNFANARSVRNLVEESIDRANARIQTERDRGKQHTETELVTLTRADVLGEPIDISNSSVLNKLDSLIGLESVKESVRNLIHLAKENFASLERGETELTLTLHRVFLGNPGTGKTTVASIYGQILGQLGFLSKGDEEPIVVGASKLTGDVVGSAAKLTNGYLDQAKGKVLVIDEAYVLANSSYGKEALDVLVERVQGPEDMCVILCGYEDDMKKLMRDGNPGLTRRFRMEDAFRFEDYTDEQLSSIMVSMAKKMSLDVTKSVADAAVRNVLAKQRDKPNFGNAGAVMNLLQRGQERMQARLAKGNAEKVNGRFKINEDDLFTASDSDAAFKELDKLFKVDHIKSKVEQLRKQAKVMLKSGKSHHEILRNWLFVGPPGTGKTTVARVFGQIFHSLELLSDDRVVECKAMDLMASFVGQTKDLVNAKMKEARGGVLFIDEAYGLVPRGGNSFAKDAIETILANLTHDDYKGKMIVIMAGYKEDMGQLVGANAGMPRRFTEQLEFLPWDTDDCMTLTCNIAKDNKLELSSTVKELFRVKFFDLIRRDGWGNAGDVHTVVNKVLESRNLRCDDDGNVSGPVVVEDVIAAFDDMFKQRPLKGATNSNAKANVDDTMLCAPMINIKQNEAQHQIEKTEEAAKIEEPAVAVDDGTNSGSDGDDEVLLSALLMAIEAGYSTLEARRDALTAPENLPEHILEEIARIANKTSTIVKRHLARLCGRGLSVISELLRIHLDEQRRLKEARDAAEKARIEEEIRVREKRQAKLRLLGICPAGYVWVPTGDGYRCSAGGHYFSNEQIDMYTVGFSTTDV